MGSPQHFVMFGFSGGWHSHCNRVHIWDCPHKVNDTPRADSTFIWPGTGPLHRHQYRAHSVKYIKQKNEDVLLSFVLTLHHVK